MLTILNDQDLIAAYGYASRNNLKIITFKLTPFILEKDELLPKAEQEHSSLTFRFAEEPTAPTTNFYVKRAPSRRRTEHVPALTPSPIPSRHYYVPPPPDLAPAAAMKRRYRTRAV